MYIFLKLENIYIYIERERERVTETERERERELAPKLMATASVVYKSRVAVQFHAEALDLLFRNWLRLKMYIFPDTRIYHTLKHLSVDNECNCQILSLIYTYVHWFVSFDLIFVIKFGLLEKYLLD